MPERLTDEEAQIEEEANIFARCLLVPTQFLRNDIQNMGGIDMCDDVAVRSLADRYKVPIAVMVVRISEVLRLEGGGNG